MLLGDLLGVVSEIESHAAYLSHSIELRKGSLKVLFELLSEQRLAADLNCSEAATAEPAAA